MRSSPLSALGMFVLGACASVAVQTSASKPAAPTEVEAEPAEPNVLALAAAPRAIAPNGSASITHLARGHNAYLGKLEMNPGGTVPIHRDPTEEFIHVLQGHGTMTIEGREYAIDPGTTIYMPAGVEVSYRNGDETMIAIQVFAGPEPASKYESWAPAP